jgi:hypothetical protein
MSKGISRSINTDQIKLRELNLIVSSAGDLSGPSAGSASCVKSTGTYVITLQSPFEQAAIAKSLVLIGNSGVIRMESSSASTITIKTYAVDGTTATDKAFSICILGSDFRHYV